MEKKILYEATIKFEGMVAGYPTAFTDRILVAEDNLNGACLTVACWANREKEKFSSPELVTYKIVKIEEKEMPVYISGKGAL